MLEKLKLIGASMATILILSASVALALAIVDELTDYRMLIAVVVGAFGFLPVRDKILSFLAKKA
jgi:hypothetical protein